MSSKTKDEDATLSAEEIAKVKESESIDSDMEFMLMILEMLCKNLPEKLENIEKGLKDADHQAVWKEAHSIKGSSLQCSLTALGQAAKAVEHHYKKLDEGEDTTADGEKASGEELIDMLKYEAKRVQNATAQLRKENPE